MKNQDFLETITEFKLEQWGLYMRLSDTYGRLSLTTSRPATLPDITDDQAVWVDQGVATLRRRDWRMGQMLILHYVNKLRLCELAEYFNIHRNTMSAHIKGAESWMDCYFHMHTDQLRI